MDEILNKSISEMAGTVFDCSCGKTHNFSVREIKIGKGAINAIAEIAEPFRDGTVLVVSDSNTYPVAGKKTAGLLKDSGYRVKELLFEVGDDILLPDEKTLGRILMEMELDTSLIIAVGSGVINDSVKFVTSRTGLDYIIVATAPSMDGYVSDGAPIIMEGYKYSPVAHLTYGLIGDTDVLKTAPQDLIQAGFGDMVGKITALTDWDLAVNEIGEYRCDTCVELTNIALEKTISTCDGLKYRDPVALGNLLEGLTLTGVAMGLINNSRPASGAEHMLSHYWEMEYIKRGLNPIHHGVQVGCAAPVIARFFEQLSDILPESTVKLSVSHEEIERLLERADCAVSPKDIGIDRDLFYNSLVEGYSVRPRYSVLRYAKEKGRLEEIAENITDELYG